MTASQTVNILAQRVQLRPSSDDDYDLTGLADSLIGPATVRVDVVADDEWFQVDLTFLSNGHDMVTAHGSPNKDLDAAANSAMSSLAKAAGVLKPKRTTVSRKNSMLRAEVERKKNETLRARMFDIASAKK